MPKAPPSTIKIWSFLRLSKTSFTSLGKALEKGEVDGALADEFKSLGSQNKDSLKGMKNGLFHIDESVLQQQFKDQYPLIHNLVELTIAFHKAYDEAKKEQGIMDFSDLEHLCLALLVEPGTEDDPQPSEVALELQDTFKEIKKNLGKKKIKYLFSLMLGNIKINLVEV